MATRSTQSAYDIEMLRKERDDARSELAALRKRVAELESEQAKDYWKKQYDQLASAVAELYEWEPLEDAESAIVTPNNCRHCQRAAEKMRDAAAVVALSIPLQFYDTRTQREIAKAINALPLPSCDGCSPLNPCAEQANQADSLQAWADLWEHIAGRIGTGETPLPNAANFDAMLLPWAISA